MGCDIHLHTEVKIDGQWHHYGNPHCQRRYGVFAKMAGVRNYNKIEPISPPKGLPADVSLITKLDADRWDGDGHSHSWLGLDEIKQLYAWWNEGKKDPDFTDWPDHDYGYVFSGGWDVLPGDVPCVEDVRFVFWFDN